MGRFDKVRQYLAEYDQAIASVTAGSMTAGELDRARGRVGKARQLVRAAYAEAMNWDDEAVNLASCSIGFDVIRLVIERKAAA